MTDNGARWTDQLPVRAVNALRHVLKIDQPLHERPEHAVANEAILAGAKAFRAVRNFGKKSYVELRKWLASLGHDVSQW